MSDIAKKLSAPFPLEDIEWRVERCGKTGDKIWALVLCYITNRAIMERLDEVVGFDKWQNSFMPGPDGGFQCGIAIKIGDEWIWKFDGADKTQFEAIKGGFSGSMKRAAVQWGIGRYLYKLEHNFAEVCNNGKYKGKDKEGNHFKWNPPQMPTWALPEGAIIEKAKKALGGEELVLKIKKEMDGFKDLRTFEGYWKVHGHEYKDTLSANEFKVVEGYKNQRKEDLGGK
jgi:hypothetical protein